MSTLVAEDASEVEGVNKRKETTQKKEKEAKQTESENDEKPQPSKKSGWGTEGSALPAEEIIQSTVEFNYDEPEEEDSSRLPQEDSGLLDQVASPPKALMNKVQTIRELSVNSQFNIPNAKESGIDLNLLTQALSSKDQVVEADEEWQFESLFVRVTGELQVEMEAEEEVKREIEQETEETVSVVK